MRTMDVRCDRCGTEYEFDDALISERGTTVQCTECGSKFKVFPSAGAPAPERWVVRGGGAQGWETHFVSLRDLQAAIARGAVGPGDMLSRGNEAPRALSTIAELEPFFTERNERKKLAGTLAGVAPPLHVSAAPKAPLPETGSRAPEPPTQAVPAKRRVSTKMGLPTPADAPAGFTSLSAPPPELTPDAPPVEIPQASRVPQRPFDKTLASGVTDAPAASFEQRRPRGFLEPEAPPARDHTSTLQSFGARSPDVRSPDASAPRSPAAAGTSGEHPSQPRQRIVSVLSASELSSSPQAPTVASVPLDKPPAFSRTMLGMSQAPTVPGATPQHAPQPEAAPQPAPQPEAAPAKVMTEVPRPASSAPAPQASVTPSPDPALGGSVAGAEASSPAHTLPGGSSAEPHVSVQLPPVHYAATKVSFGTEPVQVVPQQAAPPAPQQIVRPQEVVAPQEVIAPQATPARVQSRPSVAEPVSDELPDHIPGTGRRGPLRVVVALVLVGAAGLAGATVGRPTLERLLKQQAEAPAAPPRASVEPLVAKARELVREADLGGARDQLERAAGAAGPASNAVVASELARVDILAAELEDLRLLLIPPDQTERVDQVKESLMDHLDRARKSVAAAAQAAPTDPGVLRAQMSLSRLAGDRARAVEQSASSSAANASAEDVYAFAALDLTESPPKYAEAIDRLGAAVGSEGRLGIVRGALIYALVRSGDRERAALELERLKGQVTPGSKLLPDVEAFVQREAPGAEAASAVSAVSAPPGAPAAPVPAPGAAPAGAPDFRVRLQRAHDALTKGDLSQADSLYRSVLQDNSGNTEAVAGLADVARRRGQTAEAARLYDQVLTNNPSYLPALLARADMLWSSGERSQALKLYRRVTDQVGSEGTYGKHAQSRIDAAAADNGNQQPTTSPTSSEKPGQAAPNDAGEAPLIDTTDLK